MPYGWEPHLYEGGGMDPGAASKVTLQLPPFVTARDGRRSDHQVRRIARAV